MIRDARPGDIDGLLALQAAWPGLPKWSRTHLVETMSGGRERLWVAEEDGQAAGFGALRVVPPEAEITLVVVEPGRVRRGLGRAILSRLHEAAREAGCSLVGLEVSATNRSAIALYESAGYRVVGRRPKYYHDGSDALLMSLRLA
ncbi:MAG: ribosomal protein S18-alanine N-acetyltransferase [Elusimicrobia bacterium]|nr:ribosomal protein S18-alanine N-acetyltransferase [Elusimicrobiota bacterium]